METAIVVIIVSAAVWRLMRKVRRGRAGCAGCAGGCPAAWRPRCAG